MEDTLRAEDIKEKIFKMQEVVLILVLMEDTLREVDGKVYYSIWCLNPCFNGRYS